MVRFLRTIILIAFVLSGYYGLSQTVVISEVYGGGGNSGATYKNDFIELFNPTGVAVDLTGWSVQYASSAGSTWAVTNLNGSIPPYSYYLIQEAAGTGGTVSLPTPNVIGTINMSGTTGKVALVNGIVALSGTCPTGYVDLIGFGTANCFEGTVGPGTTNALSDERKSPCIDTNNNANDFRNSSPNPQNTSSVFAIVAFTSGYPKTQSITSTGFQLVTNLDNNGTTYYVILPSGATAPTSTQVKNGQDGSGAPVTSGFSGSIGVAAAATEYTNSVSLLNPSTTYDVYFVAERCILQSAPILIQTTTLPAVDTTPPANAVGYPKIQNITSTEFQAATKIDEGGITYFVILANGSAAPSPTQVKAGLDGSGSALPSNLKGQITVASANTEFTSSATGLFPSTDYSVYFISEDVAPNLQASVAQVDISTPAPPVIFSENFNNCDGTASFIQYSAAGDQVWGCTDFGRASKGIRMNGFSGTAVVNEDWLISPVLTLAASPSLSFYSQFSFAGNGLQLKISTDYSGSGNPAAATWTNLNGGFPTVAVGSTSTALSDWTLSNVDLSAYASQNVYLAFVYTSTSSQASRWTLDEINVNDATASYLQVTPSAISFKASGTSKSYNLKGVNLQNGVTVTAPANFEVSKDNSAFGNSISYTAVEANAQQTVYVRFTAPGATADTYTGSVTNESTGVASKNVSVKGTDMSQTFDVATYNLEFFGTDVRDASNVEFGPTDDALQIANVATVMQTIGADIYGVEEVADDNAFNQLVANLPGYDKILSNRWSYSFDPPDPNFPPQKVGFIYNTSTVQIVSSRVMFVKLYDDIKAGTVTLPNYPSGTSSSFWSSGRLPFMVTADVSINGVTKRIRLIDIHAKSGSAQADYDRRKYDVQVLHDSLTANYPTDHIILVGDYNDDVDASINIGSPSSYKVFVDDNANFNVLTYALSQTGASSFPSSSSFIDHIVISNELTPSYVSNSIALEDARNYISNYVNTTSDHLPVTARFLLVKDDQTISFTPPPAKVFGDPTFNLTATASSGLGVSFVSSDPSIASITGNTVTILKAGTVDITASQGGSSSYNAASDVVKSLVIAKANQTISFALLPAKTFGDAPFNLTATSDSGLPVSLASADALSISITGNTATILKAGTIDITASQAGDDNYNPATNVVQPQVVNKAGQTITFSALADKTVGDAAFNLTSTATSGLTVSFNTTSDKITITGNQATIVKAGRASITAAQAGNTNYNAATSVDQSFCIKPAKPTVSLSNANTPTPILNSSATAGNQWYLNGAIIAGATNQTLNVTGPGIYKVQSQVDDCVSLFSSDTPIIITGDLTSPTGRITVYPNPVADFLEVRGIESEVNSSQVVDLTGRTSSIVLEKNGTSLRGSVEHLSAGIYILRIHEGATVHQTKFIKK